MGAGPALIEQSQYGGGLGGEGTVGGDGAEGGIVLACPGLSLKKLVFVLRIFCFELLTPSSTVDLLYLP